MNQNRATFFTYYQRKVILWFKRSSCAYIDKTRIVRGNLLPFLRHTPLLLNPSQLVQVSIHRGHICAEGGYDKLFWIHRSVWQTGIGPASCYSWMASTRNRGWYFCDLRQVTVELPSCKCVSRCRKQKLTGSRGFKEPQSKFRHSRSWE